MIVTEKRCHRSCQTESILAFCAYRFYSDSSYCPTCISFLWNFYPFLEPETFPTIFDGIWWAIITASTVGYGDYVPHSVLGRLTSLNFNLVWRWLCFFLFWNIGGSSCHETRCLF